MSPWPDYLSNMTPAIDAAAEGKLRCGICDITLTVLDPFTNLVEPYPADRRSSDSYWREAESLTRFVNKKCREKGLTPPQRSARIDSPHGQL